MCHLQHDDTTVSINRPQSRNADKFILPKTRTETFKSSFLPSTVKLWNMTPAYIRDHLSILKMPWQLKANIFIVTEPEILI